MDKPCSSGRKSSCPSEQIGNELGVECIRFPLFWHQPMKRRQK
ncbi:14069_t:CDS:2 [Ambispora leptoticha]|uniref:14069_t:CDS:1 n=1 Tax=Ambispora leptoticha TaxID=144679 RepID=A0A9N8ZG17_9GLOM|nr:14069_t:CDS:2 [Ambispora leptoticha]